MSKNSNLYYKKARELFMYAGECNSDDDRRTLIVGYSPNNIRRVIFSPDNIGIELYVPYKGKSFFKTHLSMKEQEELGDGFTAVKALGTITERRMGNLEEIIFCVRATPVSGKRYVNDFDCSVVDYSLIFGTNSKPATKESIRGIYKRLAYITMVDYSFEQFLSGIKNFSNRQDILVTDVLKSYNLPIQYDDVNSKDWYLGISCGGYSIDDEVKQKLEKLRDVKISKDAEGKKKEKLKESSSAFDKAVDLYSFVATKYLKLQELSKQSGMTYLSGGVSLKGLTLKSPKTIKEEFSKLKSKEECEKYISSIKGQTGQIYNSLIDFLFGCIKKVRDTSQVASVILIKALEPIYLSPDYADLGELYNIKSETKANIRKSTAIICEFICNYLLVNDLVPDKFKNDEYWTRQAVIK